MEKMRISSVQLLILLSITQDATAFLLVPSFTTQTAGRDAWISALIFTNLYGLMVGLLSINLAKYFPQETLTEYLPKIIGQVPGKIIAFIYTFFFIHVTSIILAEETDFIHVNFFRETPLLPLNLLIIVAVIYGVYLGIEVIARLNEISFPIFFLAIIILFALISFEIDWANFLPLMENGLIPAIKGSIIPSSWRGEIFIMLMLFPYLNQKEEAKKVVIGVIVLSGILSTLAITFCIGVLGEQITADSIYPVFRLARYISLARFLERLEILIVIIWAASAVVKLSVFFYCGCIAAANTFGLKNYRLLILPITLITLIVSHVFYNTYPKLVNFLSSIWPVYALTIELIIPGTIFLIALLTKKRGDSFAKTKKTPVN